MHTSHLYNVTGIPFGWIPVTARLHCSYTLIAHGLPYLLTMMAIMYTMSYIPANIPIAVRLQVVRPLLRS